MTDALTGRAIRDRCSALGKRRIGECLLDLERFNEAEEMLVSAAGKLDALRDEEGQARVLTVLADARLTAGDAATAFDELERALAVMRRSGSRKYIADVLRQVGRAARDLGRRDTAKLYWTEAHAAHRAQRTQRSTRCRGGTGCLVVRRVEGTSVSIERGAGSAGFFLAA